MTAFRCADSGSEIEALTVTATGTVYLTGSTTTTGYPTVLPYQATYGGAGDAFIAKLEPSEPRVFVTNPADGATVSGTVWADVWVENYVGTSNTFTLSVGGNTVATGTATNHATLPWDSRAIADGGITLTAAVADSAGHVGTRTRITIWIENAAAGSKTYTLTESGRTLATTTTSNGPVSMPWVATTADNGARTPTVGVRDASGATGSGSIAVTVAN